MVLLEHLGVSKHLLNAPYLSSQCLQNCLCRWSHCCGGATTPPFCTVIKKKNNRINGLLWTIKRLSFKLKRGIWGWWSATPSTNSTIAPSISSSSLCFPSISYPPLVLFSLLWPQSQLDWTGAANFLLFLAGWMWMTIALLKQGQWAVEQRDWAQIWGGALISQQPPWPN